MRVDFHCHSLDTFSWKEEAHQTVLNKSLKGFLQSTKCFAHGVCWKALSVHTKGPETRVGCSSNTSEAEAGGSQVQGQLRGLCSKF